MKIDKKVILANLPFLFIFWIADKLAYMCRITEGNKIFALVKGVSELFKAPVLSFHILDILFGVLGALAVKGILYVRSKNAKKYRKGAEYGSARWGTAADIKPYMDKDFKNNILLTNTEGLTMNSRPKIAKYARNKNVLVIGGSGSGKTRFFVKPQLMQLHSSYVVTDPKGTILIECGKLLERAGYRIKVLNTINFKSPVDMLFERLEQRDPEHFAVKQYRKFKLAAGKTLKSILVSCGARLATFDIKELRDLMEYDELELDTLGDRKTAFFVIISDTDATFNFVVAMMYSQLFNLLCDKADNEYSGRLPVHVRCLLDEFANIGKIPNFEKLIATIRSREISAAIILQSQSQLKAIYKDNADTIIGNCDSTLFLGGKEKTTLKELSEVLGKETIDLYNTSETRSNQNSYGLSYQKLGKELMSQDELAVMDGGKCILQLRGVRPFLSDKFDITRHPNYKFLSDYDKKNTFDIEKYLKRREPIVSKHEVFDYYKIELPQEAADQPKQEKEEL